MGASAKDLRDAKLDPDNVRLPAELGGEYLVSLEVTHQLHCLVSI
jgi:hypothetical protein